MLSILMFALATNAPPQVMEWGVPRVVPSACGRARTDEYPKHFGSGLAIQLTLNGRLSATQQLPVSADYLTKFAVTRVDTSSTGAEDAAIVIVRSRAIAKSARQLNALLAKACSPWIGTTLKFNSLAYQNLRDRAVGVKEAARSARDDRRAAILVERMLADRRANHPPAGYEVEKWLSKSWGERQRLFSLEGSVFGRLRDLTCRKKRAPFECTVGVLATSKDGPEYRQAELGFVRDAELGLSGRDPALDDDIT